MAKISSMISFDHVHISCHILLFTVWSSELDTLLMRYGVKFTSYRIKSVSNSLDQIVLAMRYLNDRIEA